MHHPSYVHALQALLLLEEPAAIAATLPADATAASAIAPLPLAIHAGPAASRASTAGATRLLGREDRAQRLEHLASERSGRVGVVRWWVVGR